MDNIPEDVGSTNPPPSLIPYGNYSLTDSPVSVSRGCVRLKINVTWVLRNPIYPQLVKNKNRHHNTNITQHHIIPPEGNTNNKLKELYLQDKKVGKHSLTH